MKHKIQARDMRASLALYLACALISFTASCVKLPRHAFQLKEQPAPLASQAEATRAPRININTASAEELEKLPGIGRGLSARIVAFREQYGRFRRAEHLLMVRGISDRRFRAMRALITAE
jgi:competence ComEA-like helix-hairpin-helix protein